MNVIYSPLTHPNVTHRPLTESQHNNTFNHMDPKQRIGLRIKELRVNKKLSQEQLALKSEIDRTYMTSVENGRRNVSIVLIDRIIKGLETTYEEFFKGFDNIKTK